jgi:hypothetical protein
VCGGGGGRGGGSCWGGAWGAGAGQLGVEEGGRLGYVDSDSSSDMPLGAFSSLCSGRLTTATLEADIKM